MDFPAHPFWDFALDVYRRPGVSDACLALQESHRLDVNLLLFACWIGASGGGRLSGEDVRLCQEKVAPWHDAVVRPLRGVRRILKQGIGGPQTELSAGLRRAIQAREIDAEHIEQLMLTATIDRPRRAAPVAARLGDAALNALIYLQILGADRNAGQADLAVVLGAAFPEADPAAVHAALAG